MKIFFLLLLTPFFLTAQTAAERKKISDSSNKELNATLKIAVALSERQQADSIAIYKQQHKFVESEKKSIKRIENGLPIFYTTFNQGSSKTIGTDKMYPGASMGLNVTGAGMTAGVWDGGKVRATHNEFSGGKVTLGDAAATLSNHATHVTGTIIAAGLSPLRRGIAYGGEAKTYDWDSDYSEMLTFGSLGYLVSNHSYGYVASSLPVYKFGAYDASSIEIDNVSIANPFYQIVIAAGNDRNDFDVNQVANKGGYDLVSGFGSSKNGITVAAVEQVDNYLGSSSVVMSDFSNFGPTDDGRIKPDISAKGVAVNSTISSSNYAYDIYQGTSMAAPAIAGMILMLQKHYNILNPSTFMRASTIRGLICHTAKEAGYEPGPDYEFGWGLADAEAAANIISNKNFLTILEENTLNNNQVFAKQITLEVGQKLSATICWTDPTGITNGSSVDNRTPRLKNNLDLKVLKDGEIFYPWKLEVEDPSAPATQFADNDVDNIEKVEIDNASPGVYTIQVTHKGTLTGGSQVFSLIANGSTGINLNTSNYNFDNSVFVYPNPASSTLNYTIKDAIAIKSIKITDVSGKSVNNINVDLDQKYIDVSSLASGIYFATFISEQASVTKKFVKQ
ncbi:S8 family serine peptidase [Flavobacterium sp.]